MPNPDQARRSDYFRRYPCGQDASRRKLQQVGKMQIVDRRLNPKAKSLGNRQRFLRRAKGEIRDAIKDSLRSRKIAETESAEKVTIRSKSLREPSFGLGRNSGLRDYVLPATKSTKSATRSPSHKAEGVVAAARAAPNGEGQDDFTFTLTKDEFLDLFFDDLKLPNLIKVKLKDLKAPRTIRAGFSSDGPPARLNRTRTMRKSLGRRMRCRRPSQAEVRASREGTCGRRGRDSAANPARLAELRAQLERKLRLRKTIAYIDPIDLQYNRIERIPKPTHRRSCSASWMRRPR